MAEPSLSPINSTPESPLKFIRQSLEHELKLERQAVQKLDYTILPVIAMMYLLSLLDRANIGNARVAGLQKDLHFTDMQYQICITAPFAPYIASELPSNLIFRKIGPKLVLPTLLTAWGIIATLQGFVTSYSGLVTLRVFLGLVEGPLGPGVVLYLSSFYTRKELSLRIALFTAGATLSGAFSGLLSAVIGNMEGVGGKPGWAWIFILEGLFTVLVGPISFFLIPSTPRDCHLLTEHQKDIVMRRLEADRPCIKSATFSLKEVLRCITSPHVIILCIIAFMSGTMAYGLALFLPSIVIQLGFSPTSTQLLSAGPFAAGCFVTVFSAFLSDRYQSRGIPTAIVSLPAIAGYAIYLNAEHKYTLYGALYLMVIGVSSAGPILSAWIANNSEPHYCCATAVALSFILGNAGGILSTWSFPTSEGPKFRKTTIMNLIFSILVPVGSLVNTMYLSWRNKVKKRPGVRERLLDKYVVADKEGDDAGLKAWMELGDLHPDFVYTL